MVDPSDRARKRSGRRQYRRRARINVKSFYQSVFIRQDPGTNAQGTKRMQGERKMYCPPPKGDTGGGRKQIGGTSAVIINRESPMRARREKSRYSTESSRIAVRSPFGAGRGTKTVTALAKALGVRRNVYTVA